MVAPTETAMTAIHHPATLPTPHRTPATLHQAIPRTLRRTRATRRQATPATHHPAIPRTLRRTRLGTPATHRLLTALTALRTVRIPHHRATAILKKYLLSTTKTTFAASKLMCA